MFQTVRPFVPDWSLSSIFHFQCPGEPHAHGLTVASRTSVELRGSQDVSYHLVRAYILFTPRYSWSAIFLYVYTGQITFAAIGSQDGTPLEPQNSPSGGEPTLPQDRDGPGVPPPDIITGESCSPKSIYCLANKVCLSPPQDDPAVNNPPRSI